MANKLWDLKRKALTAVLKELRVEKGLSQIEVSIILSKPQSYISKYENGERRLDFVEVIDLAESLNVKPEEVLARYISKI